MSLPAGRLPSFLGPFSLMLLGVACLFAIASVVTLSRNSRRPADPGLVAFTVGSRAPAIHIDDWVHPGAAADISPITEFAPGKIYVLEFWATWCEYSREAIPLLATLQERFGPDDVVVIGLSIDVPEALRGFLKDSDPDVRELAAIAGKYCLATDPDGSVQTSFMDAIRETSVPTAFVIGRQGLVEWIGHPLDLEEPLERIVSGTWDRAAFANRWERLEAARRCVLDIQDRIATDRAVEAVALLDSFAEQHAADSVALNEVAWRLVERADYGRLPDGVLAGAERAAASSARLVPADGNVLDTLAHVQALRGNVREAIVTQQRAVALGGADAGRFQAYLDLLETRAGGK